MLNHTIIQTEQAPAPVGPYSQGVQAGSLVFLSGQIPLDPATGQIITGSIEEQTTRVLENLKAVLARVSLTFADVVKTTVFMFDLQDFPRMNEVYGTYFGSPGPARSTVQVSALPKGAGIEIELIAVMPRS